MLMAGNTQQFAAAAPTASGAITLSVAEGSAGGSIDASLLYTAPATPGTYHVIATARDGSSATSTVIVRAAGVIVIPAQVSVAPGGVVEFTTSRPADELVYWFVISADAGTIGHGTGIYQAPETPGQYEVTVTNYGDAWQATATVTVRPEPVYVTLNMPVIEGAHPGDGAVYRATVHGTNDQRVTWSIVEAGGGTINQSGNYTSPRDHAGIFHIVATSVAVPSASATALYETCTGAYACGIQAKVKDGGGAILPTSITYALFWGPSSAFPTDLQSNVEAMLQRLDGSAYLAIGDQYMRSAKTHTRFAGSVFDRTTPTATFDVGAEICRMLDANGVESRVDAVYFLYTSTPPMSSGYCAWHNYSTCHGVFIHIAYMPYPGQSATGTCENNLDLGCGQGPLTKEWTSFTAHEFMETITDSGPWRSGWYSSDRGEIGDLCTGTQACVPLGGKTFQIQGEFSNNADGCATQ